MDSSSIMNDSDVLKALKSRFDPSVEKRREGPKKKNPSTGRWEPTSFTYIPNLHVSERLDEVLGLNWNWACLDTKILTVKKEVKDKIDAGNGQYTYVPRETTVEQVAMLGRLTIILPSGKEIFRDAWGGSDLDKGSQAGDAFKIADSNAFKKAAYKFGIASYLGMDGLEDAPDQGYADHSHTQAPAKVGGQRYVGRQQPAQQQQTQVQSAQAPAQQSNPFRR